ncbi:MAG: signal peptidase I [Dongiaceae bacterium]
MDHDILSPKPPASEWWEIIKTVLYAVILALIIRSTVFEPFSIPSSSMVPTLLIGDYVIVNKYSYGYSRHSFPLSLPLFEGRIFFTQPQRGDVAVFKLPRDNKTDYIKRLVGLPGDEIQVKGGVLYINGKSVTRARLNDFIQDNGESKTRFAQYRETLPDSGVTHLILEMTEDGRFDNTPVYKVPAGHYFFMGDNRDNSMDSRAENIVGFVPEENLLGKAKYIFFSKANDTPWWEIWSLPLAIRWDRLFQSII